MSKSIKTTSDGSIQQKKPPEKCSTDAALRDIQLEDVMWKYTGNEVLKKLRFLSDVEAAGQDQRRPKPDNGLIPLL